jgi:exopolysaccharide production protein ExoZ
MRTHLASIQILRAIAALLVVIHHVADAWTTEFGLFPQNTFRVGMFGVDLFFVISGFIMCYTTAELSQRSARDFMIKRISRIVPLYYALTLFIFLLVVAAPSLVPTTAANFTHLVKSALFVPYERADGLIFPLLALGWTLNYEMFFYVAFALALMFVRKHAHVAVIVAMTLVFLAGYVLPPESVLVRFYTSSMVLEFVWGCVLFLLWKRYPGAFRNLWPLGLVGLVLLLRPPLAEDILPRGLERGLPAAMVVAGALSLRLPDALAKGLAVRLGDASYSIYLVHLFIVDGVSKALSATLGGSWFSAVLLLLVSVVVTCAISLWIYARFERPANDWMRRRLAGAPKPTAPAA